MRKLLAYMFTLTSLIYIVLIMSGLLNSRTMEYNEAKIFPDDQSMALEFNLDPDLASSNSSLSAETVDNIISYLDQKNLSVFFKSKEDTNYIYTPDKALQKHISENFEESNLDEKGRKEFFILKDRSKFSKPVIFLNTNDSLKEFYWESNTELNTKKILGIISDFNPYQYHSANSLVPLVFAKDKSGTWFINSTEDADLEFLKKELSSNTDTSQKQEVNIRPAQDLSLFDYLMITLTDPWLSIFFIGLISSIFINIFANIKYCKNDLRRQKIHILLGASTKSYFRSYLSKILPALAIANLLGLGIYFISSSLEYDLTKYRYISSTQMLITVLILILLEFLLATIIYFSISKQNKSKSKSKAKKGVSHA